MNTLIRDPATISRWKNGPRIFGMILLLGVTNLTPSSVYAVGGGEQPETTPNPPSDPIEPSETEPSTSTEDDSGGINPSALMVGLSATGIATGITGGMAARKISDETLKVNKKSLKELEKLNSKSSQDDDETSQAKKKDADTTDDDDKKPSSQSKSAQFTPSPKRDAKEDDNKENELANKKQKSNTGVSDVADSVGKITSSKAQTTSQKQQTKSTIQRSVSVTKSIR